MTAISPQALFDYANAFARKAETQDRGTQYPTVREAAKHFRVSQEKISDACEDWDTKGGYLGIAVGFRTGAGWGEYPNKGDCLVEAYT